jgi:hypothetical protein
VVEGVGVPAAVFGEFGDGVGAVREESPQVFGGVDAAGVAARHPHDRHRFPCPVLGLAQLLLRLVQLHGRPFEVLLESFLIRH